MYTKIISCCIVMLLSGLCLKAQEQVHKKISAVRTVSQFKIDGKMDEPAWQTAAIAKDFIEWRPNSGKPEEFANRTEVYFLYDDNAFYIAGHCYEQNIDSINKELVGRDVVGTNDFVGVILDTYDDKINGSGFYLTVLGEQFDAKYSNVGNEDGSWDAVWFGATQIVEDGWVFEMRIPYSALRFSKDITQWGLNITRKRNKAGKQYMWNPVVPTINGLLNQSGLLTDITNIKPPLRLSFSPYFSTYLNHYPYHTAGVKNTTTSVNGGMDVKYGINQNFTLDMTLIPDFGQVQSDQQILNLTPFEVQYNENRPFFTEGTELFNKCNLFYSRRVGSEPIHKYDIYNSIGADEQIIDNPSESKLINATKISGRNKNGLGIGVFNAITNPMYATVENKTTGEKRKMKTGSLTNYNIVVLDQTLKNNSSMSFVNTNVWRSGADYDANVSAGMIDIYTKGNKLNYWGMLSVSQKFQQDENIAGYAHWLGFAKSSGRFNFSIEQELQDDKYDKNDMGILFNNNNLENTLWIGYKWVNPGKWYNNIYMNLNQLLSYRFTDMAYQTYETSFNVNGQLKNLYNAGMMARHKAASNDFYEPRTPGAVFKTGREWAGEVWISSNQAKKYFWDFAVNMGWNSLQSGQSTYLGWGQRYRFNDRLSVSSNFTYNKTNHAVGFAGKDFINDDIVFSNRNRKTSENTFSVKYNFSIRSGINISARHYWSQVDVNKFYNLNNDGSLSENTTYNENKDFNLNLFNIDMVYTWQFAPGSFLNIVWKNAIVDESQDVRYAYFKNLDRTFEAKQNNNLSVKILYYFDFLDVKKRFLTPKL